MTQPALEIQHVSKSFDGFQVLRDVSLAIAEREVRVLIGPNGAGKTTLFHTVLGTIRPDEGNVCLLGRSIGMLPPYERQRRGIAVALQIPSLVPTATVRENLLLAAVTPKSVLRSVRPSTYETASAAVDDTLAKMQLDRSADLLAAEVHHGERKRLEIGCAIVQRPHVLLLDEPTAGLSAGEVDRMVTLIGQVRKATAVLIIEHRLSFLESMPGQIAVLHDGEIIFEGSLDECRRNTFVQRVYFGQRTQHA